jgi:glycosyltransferase involved in cell wall biosynthesis
MANQKKLSLIIPAFNEEESIGKTIDEITAVLGKSNIDCEVIVVDDGSHDRTAEIVKSKGIRLIQHKRNMGYGSSIKDGLRSATCDCVGIIDGDGTYPPELIPVMLEKMDGNDMVVGARIGKNVKIPLIRKPAKWVINKLANYLSGERIPDINSGLRIMKREVVEKFINLLPDGFSLTTTITLAMLTEGHKVEFHPIDYRKREGRSKIRPVRDTLNFFQLIVRTIMYFDPLKIFFPLSLILFLASALVLVTSYFFARQVMDITTIILFVGALHMLAIGLIADLVVKRDRL